MVSMFVDIRQAAELLARFSSGHGLPRVVIDIANKISYAAQFHGLQFYSQYRDPVDGVLKPDTPIEFGALGAAFSIATDDKGLPFVRPNGKLEGAIEKVFAKASGCQHNPSPHDGEWVACHVVSIEDVVMHPNFGFPKEKQDAILEAHKAAVLAKQEQALLQKAQIGVAQNSSHEEKPWMVRHANDPEPAYWWYTPARYFARKLVLDDSTLSAKRNLLASKVVKSLSNAGIRKRGDQKDFDPSTVRKAFANVTLG